MTASRSDRESLDLLSDEIAAVLRSNPDATDAEVCDAVNRWWQRVRTDDSTASVKDVCRIRESLGIPPTERKPHQKRLFE